MPLACCRAAFRTGVLLCPEQLADRGRVSRCNQAQEAQHVLGRAAYSEPYVFEACPKHGESATFVMNHAIFNYTVYEFIAIQRDIGRKRLFFKFHMPPRYKQNLNYKGCAPK
jgi:hypothetical protein